MQRNYRIDLLRGWLILLVIVGHIVLGSIHDNEIRYAIYAFHMPLFIGISGYLINVDKLRQAPLVGVLRNYWWRVLLPFAFAFAFFTGVLYLHAWQEGRLNEAMIIKSFVTPYYHLWFVPTLVMWVIGYWCALKLRIPIKIMSLSFIIIVLFWACVPRRELPTIIAALLSKKVIYYYGFFLFGVLLKTGALNSVLRFARDFKALPAALVFFCAVIYFLHIGPQKELLKGAGWLIMNLSLIVISVVWMMTSHKHRSDPKGGMAVLTTMGRISLPIYLWHMLPMFLLKGFDIHQSHTVVYYIVSVVCTTMIVMALIKFENKSGLLNKTVYGT